MPGGGCPSVTKAREMCVGLVRRGALSDGPGSYIAPSIRSGSCLIGQQQKIKLDCKEIAKPFHVIFAHRKVKETGHEKLFT